MELNMYPTTNVQKTARKTPVRSRKSVIPVVCVKLGKLYVVKHNCVT